MTRIKKENNQSCASNSECSSDYCTPTSLTPNGERHCCNTGQKWGIKLGKWQCIGSQGCENISRGRINNCINAVNSTLTEKGRRNFNEGINYLAQECVTSGKVCCEIDLGGIKSTEFVNKGDCIKPY